MTDTGNWRVLHGEDLEQELCPKGTMERLRALEAQIAASGGLKCMSCDDVGWYAVQVDYDQWEQCQCAFCYVVDDSIFNRNEALQTNTEERE